MQMDWTDYLRYVMSLLFVLALMGGLFLLLRRFGLGNINPVSAKKRLQVVEILSLDSRRRAVLIRRDDKEHLVILGPTGETVVETNIATSDSKITNENPDRI